MGGRGKIGLTEAVAIGIGGMIGGGIFAVLGLAAEAVNLLLLLSYVVMLSLYSHAFGAYLAALFGWGFWPAGQIFATLVLLFFAWLNLRGAKTVGHTEDVIVGIKLFILLLFSIIGLYGVQWGRFTQISADWGSIIAGGFLIFLAYEFLGECRFRSYCPCRASFYGVGYQRHRVWICPHSIQSCQGWSAPRYPFRKLD